MNGGLAKAAGESVLWDELGRSAAALLSLFASQFPRSKISYLN